MVEAPASAPHRQRQMTGLQAAAARDKPLIDPTDPAGGLALAVGVALCLLVVLNRGSAVMTE